MTRYAKGHKTESKQHILDAAAALFRRDGLDAVGIASLMEAAGLTHGGFYAHFASKAALEGEAIAVGLAETTARHRVAGATAPPGKGLERIVARYLSRTHRDGRERGCVIASLAPEIARRAAPTRSAFTRGVRELLSLLAEHTTSKPDSAALQVLSTLVGSLQLARAVDDPDLSNAFLREGKRAALQLGSFVDR